MPQYCFKYWLFVGDQVVSHYASKGRDKNIYFDIYDKLSHCKIKEGHLVFKHLA